MNQAERAPGIEWLAWSGDVFARATALRKPILLWICATWSDGCREMERVSYGDPRVIAAINERFVAVRVDADERPDVADRYDLGGIPTTAFLTPDGAVLGGGTYVPPDRLLAALARVAGAWGEEAARAASRAADAEHSNPHQAADPVDDDRLLAQVLETFDDVHAGFGAAPKFPHTAPVRLMLDVHGETGDAMLLKRATGVLDAMGWSDLSDAADGGFFRYCTGRDWSSPQREKLLMTNASLMDLYFHAAASRGHERWLTRAQDALFFIERRLRRCDGAWRISANTAASRVLSDANALTVSAMFHASRVLDDEAIATRALETLEHVLLSTYRPGEGIAHFGGGVRGLLSDHVFMAAANLDAWDVTGHSAYRMMAEELMHYLLRTMWVTDGGGFQDRHPAIQAAEPMTVPHPVRPFVLNCEAALVLRRLADASNDPHFRDRAAATVAALAPLAHSQGALAAHYLLARRAILR